MAPFDNCTIDINDGTVVVSGELDSETSRFVVDAVIQLAGPHVAHLALDLSEVSFLDSAGLHALLRLRQTRSIELIAVSPRVERVLDITGTRPLLLGPTPTPTPEPTKRLRDIACTSEV
jgi:anti-anti-sigma factor